MAKTQIPFYVGLATVLVSGTLFSQALVIRSLKRQRADKTADAEEK